MKKKGRWIPVIGCLMLVLFLAGCGKTIDIQSTAEQEIPSQNQIVVGVSQLGSESMWRTAIRHPSNRHCAKKTVIFTV